MGLIRGGLEVNKGKGMADLKIPDGNFFEIPSCQLFFNRFAIHKGNAPIVVAQFFDCFHIADHDLVSEVMDA